jgi:hypothetical protein
VSSGFLMRLYNLIVMKKYIPFLFFCLFSWAVKAQSYGTYCDTCVYQLSRDSLNASQVQSGKPITPKIHKATMMMMDRKLNRAFFTLSNLLALKASIDSTVGIANTQTITGKKTFADTIKATKGIKSDGLITTKGLNTEGATNKASATFNGVRKGKRRVITANTTLDGTDFFLEIECSSADIIIQTPPLTSDTEGWIFDIIRTDNTSHVAKFQRPDGSFINILNKRAATLRNNSINWNFD